MYWLIMVVIIKSAGDDDSDTNCDTINSNGEWNW